jgi:hypothetical protein
MNRLIVVLIPVFFARDVSAASGDDTLRYFIRNSDIIVCGTIVSEVIGKQDEVGVKIYQLTVEISEIIHGTSPGKVQFSFNVTRFELRPGDELPYMKKGSKCIFCLKKDPYWHEADMWFCAQPYNSHMASRIKELAKETK